MRSRIGWGFWRQQWDPARHLPRRKVQFCHLRPVPQTAPRTPPVAARDNGVWKRGWDQIARAEVKTPYYPAICRIEQDHIVRKVIGNQQVILSRLPNHHQSGGIGNCAPSRHFAETGGYLLAPGKSLRCDLDETLRFK